MSQVNTFQEVGMLVGRMILAFLAVRIRVATEAVQPSSRSRSLILIPALFLF